MMQLLKLLEVGGIVFDFNGDEKGCNWQSKLHIICPTFYWKVNNFRHICHNYFMDFHDYQFLDISSASSNGINNAI
jgi:hypothetical protein